MPKKQWNNKKEQEGRPFSFQNGTLGTPLPFYKNYFEIIHSKSTSIHLVQQPNLIPIFRNKTLINQTLNLSHHSTSIHTQIISKSC